MHVDEIAFAKVNLDLRVCGRRRDGYHDLDSIVVFANIGDHLSFSTADGLQLVIEGPFGRTLAEECDNLVVHAARGLAEMASRPASVHITLDKRLPIASGLGGGSADAAATLRGLTKLWHLPFSMADLMPLARTLGADVPVCLGSSAAWMQGVGDDIVPLHLAAVRRPLILANPGLAIATSDVFRRLDVFSGMRDRQLDSKANVDLLDLVADSVNDLEAPAIQTAPAVAAVLDALRAQPGCALARMSGSGATCFGMFGADVERDRAALALQASNPGWWVASAEFQ